VPPYIDGLKASVPEWFTWPQEKRNAEAKRLLREAGYSPEKPLTLTLLYNTSDLHRKMAIAAASLWKQNIGVNVKLENQEWKTFLSTRHQGNYDLARAGWCADYNEPSSFLNSMLSDSSSNTSHYKSAAFDAFMVKSLQVTNDEARTAVYQQAETQLDRDAVTIPIFYYANTRLVKPYVGGLTGNDPLDNIHVKDLYILQH
ncbi:ABC transporter substrate-binding protein, partial [Candidatus Symbiopectobacterium sp. NZEC135]